MIMRMRRFLSFLILLVLGGCATMPMGPSVNAMPEPGKSFEQFQAEDAICRQWAEQQIGKSPQEGFNQDTATGAVVGTATGAALGALIGAASGNAGTGAAIGAGSGLLLGTAAGANAGQAYVQETQRRYDMVYSQCMYAKGNQIPGMMPNVPQEQQFAPPSPPPTTMDSEQPYFDPSNPPPSPLPPE